jgi:hypothetical protein
VSLKELIDREIGKHPHNEPLLKAFRPVWEERERLLVRVWRPWTTFLYPISSA